MAYKGQWSPQKKETRKIEGPMVRDGGKYGILCCIPFGRYNSEFAFGLTKAKAIKQYYAFICKFIEDQEQAKVYDFEVTPEIQAKIDARKEQMYGNESPEARMLRLCEWGHESTENYTKFREGAEV